MNSALLSALVFILAVTTATQAVVNPSLQPPDIARRHKNIVAGIITKTDDRTRTLTIRIDQVIDGEFKAAELVLEVPQPEGAGGESRGGGMARGKSGTDLYHEADAGDGVVAFLGKSRTGHEGEGLLYQGMEWHEVNSDGRDPARWTWKRGLGDQMRGTFVGQATQLARMMADDKAGRAFFPAVPFTRFKEDRVIGTWTGSLRGVAIADLNGDGRPGLVGTGETGCRVYIQTGPLIFTDSTEALGLTGLNARSVSVADIDGDGRVDLLFDGRLFLNQGGRFAVGKRLPAAAAQQVKVSAFVDLNGDGWADVLVSREGGGLTAWLNPGPKGGAFVEATATLGFDTPEAGTGQTGFVIPGDWNSDGRTDLFYAAAKGFLLIQDPQGRFRPDPSALEFSFRADNSSDLGLTGAGCFAPLWREDSTDLVVPGDSSIALVANLDGKMEDMVYVGNESNIARTSQLAILAEDLNMDGYVDLFTLTRRNDLRNIFHTNRGYGSYMVDDLYARGEIMPGTAYYVGQWGAAAGDVDGDGATDLLLGGVDGKLRLVLNDALSHRVPKKNDLYQQQVLNRTAIIAVDPAPGRGMVGARITVAGEDGKTITWRRLGDAVLTGCSGLHQARIAIRQPGPVKVTMRWSDGAVASKDVVLEPGKVTTVKLERPSP